MMKNIKLPFVCAAVLALTTFSAKAGEPLKADVTADIVSTYAWRGQKLDGVAIQPTLGLEWNGLSLSAWGSTGFTGDSRELDFTLAYSIAGLTVGVTDYWCADSSTKYFDFSDTTPHVVEFNVGYDLGFMAINWYTNCLGAVGYNADGKKAYSSYLELSAPFTLGELEWEAAVGATPWGTDYYGTESFGVVCMSLKATKELELGTAKLPVFAQIMANPSAALAFFTVGVTF